MDHARLRERLRWHFRREDVVNHLVSKHAAFIAWLAGALTVASVSPGCRGIIGVEERELVDDTSSALSCETYCSSVEGSCDEDFPQYASPTACMKMCATFPTGTLDDKGVNTLGCRLGVSEDIFDTGETNTCDGAGPLGKTLCGTPCEAYCESLSALCPEEFATFDGDCLNECAKVPTACTYTADATRNDDSIQCRMFHLTSAAVDPGTHCPHAIADGHCTETTITCATTQ